MPVSAEITQSFRDLKLPAISNNSTLEECVKELKHLEDLQRKLEQYRRVVLGNMEELLKICKKPEKKEKIIKDVGKNDHSHRIEVSPKNSYDNENKHDDSNEVTIEKAPKESVIDRESSSTEKGSSLFTFQEPEFELSRSRSVLENDKEISNKSDNMNIRTCNFLWENLDVLPEYTQDSKSTPLIAALNKLKWQYEDIRQIKKWCVKLTKLFEFSSDESGIIGEEEYITMVHQLPLSNELKKSLSTKFSVIDNDNSGGINLTEFLYFFLQYKPFREELNKKFWLKELAPSTFYPSWMQTVQLLVYNVVNVPQYNTFAKLLFCIDAVVTLVPCIILFIQAVCPNCYGHLLVVEEDKFLWSATIFFAVQYSLGLLTSAKKISFFSNIIHLIELISFLPYIVYEGAGYTGEEINPRGFVLFRVLRVFKLTAIFPSRFKYVQENLHLYADSLKLAYVSYKTFGWLIINMTVYFSMLIYVFERGNYDPGENMWRRQGEESESPFANFINCIYFTLVTGTTLGYGDMCPKTYVGKFIALLTVVVGLVNLTFLINIIDDCFEEVFRRFLQRRIATIDNRRSTIIRGNVAGAQEKLDLLQKRSKTRLSKQGNYNASFFSAPLETYFFGEGILQSNRNLTNQSTESVNFKRYKTKSLRSIYLNDL